MVYPHWEKSWENFEKILYFSRNFPILRKKWDFFWKIQNCPDFFPRFSQCTASMSYSIVIIPEHTYTAVHLTINTYTYSTLQISSTLERIMGKSWEILHFFHLSQKGQMFVREKCLFRWEFFYWYGFGMVPRLYSCIYFSQKCTLAAHYWIK